MALASKVINQAGAIREFEKPEVCEAIEVANVNKWTVSLSPMEWHEREARLKKEYGKNHIKCDFSGNKSIEHCGEPAPGEEQPKENSLKAATDAFILQANEIMRLKKKNAELLEAIDKMKEGNPALNESASQFNDALLDEQAKKIKRLGKENARLNGIIHKKNLKIEELRKESSRHLRGKIKMFGENVDLEQMLKDKNAILADVAEELRLTKIREKNLAELGLKYVGENEKLKKQLADKVVDKIDAQALKSAESALAYKEKVIAEKDEVIADLTHELKAKHKKYVWYKGAYDAAQQILNTIADYAAKHPDKKISDPMVGENHPTEDNPEEIEIEKAVKLVRKAMKEGHTVTIDYKD